MLTPKQAAERINVSDSLIYEWCSAGILPHYRFGKPGRRGKILIDEVELDAFMAAHRREVRREVPSLKHITLDHG
jgi:excisionase family DNA binding protein